MTSLYSDTAPEAEAVLIRRLREVPPWRKLEMVAQRNEAVKPCCSAVYVNAIRKIHRNRPSKRRQSSTRMRRAIEADRLFSSILL